MHARPDIVNPLAPAPPREPLWRHLAVFGGYLALALLVTWPLALHVPGAAVQKYELPVDAGQGIWNLWWARESMLRGWNPFITDYIFFPQRVNLFYQTLSLPNALLVLPVLLAFGPVTAFNCVVLLSFALGGYLAYRLARGLAGTLAALAGGFAFAFSAYHLQIVMVGALEVIAIHWIPFYALVLLRALRQPTVARWLAAAAALLLATLASSYYGLFLAVYTAAHALLHSSISLRESDAVPASDAVLHASVAPSAASHGQASPIPRALRGSSLRALRVLRGLFLLYAVWAGTLLLYAGAPGRIEASLMGDWYARQVFQAAALVDFLAPTTLHPLWGARAAAWLDALSPAGVESGAALGYTVYALAALALLRAWRSAWPWGLLALVCLLLALGPELKLGAAPTGLPLPYALLDALGPFRNSTRPNYFIAVLTLPLSVLVALGIQALPETMRGRWFFAEGRCRSAPPRTLALVAAALLVFELWPHPLPLLPLAVSPAATALRADLAAGAVLELPPRTNDSRAMLNQLCHGRPLAGGYLARTPDYPPVNAASALRRLWLADPGQPDIFAHDPAGELATLGVRFVALNTDQMSGARVGRLRALLDAPGIARVGAGAPEVYAVDPAAARPAVRPGAGWHAPERDGARVWRWTSGAAELELLARAPSTVTLAFTITAYAEDRPLALALDGAPLAVVRAPAAPGSRAVRLRFLLPAGSHRLTLASGAAGAPDGRALGVSVGPVTIGGAPPPPAPGQRVMAIPETLAPPPGALCRT